MLSRRTLLAQYHIGAKRLFGEDEYLRRAWMERQTGHRSAAACTDAELQGAVRELRGLGALDGAARGGVGDDRPTAAQWARLAGLARARGWDRGLEDPRLLAFVVRTAKVSEVRFLTRLKISACLLGLERWAAQDERKDPAL